MNELNKVTIDEIPLNEEFGIFVLEKNVTNYSDIMLKKRMFIIDSEHFNFFDQLKVLLCQK